MPHGWEGGLNAATCPTRDGSNPLTSWAEHARVPGGSRLLVFPGWGGAGGTSPVWRALRELKRTSGGAF